MGAGSPDTMAIKYVKLNMFRMRNCDKHQNIIINIRILKIGETKRKLTNKLTIQLPIVKSNFNPTFDWITFR